MFLRMVGEYQAIIYKGNDRVAETHLNRNDIMYVCMYVSMYLSMYLCEGACVHRVHVDGRRDGWMNGWIHKLGQANFKIEILRMPVFEIPSPSL